MQKLTDGGKYKAVVDGSTAQAQQLGITGVPAYILGNKYANNGAQPYDAFQELMARLELELQEIDG